MIEIYLLEQLQALKKYGTLSLAAEQLNTTQPTLSRSMQKIENILGIKILNRQGNRVKLNDIGELVAVYAERILNQEQELLNNINIIKKNLNSLSIGSVAPGPLIKILPQATSIFSDLTITSQQSDQKSLIQGLKSGEYGIIILNHPLKEKNIISKKYFTEQLFLSVPPKNIFANKKSVSFSQLNGQNFIMISEVGIWEKTIKKHMPDSNFFKQSSQKALFELIEHSEMLAFSSNVTLMNNKTRILIPFEDKESKETFYIICLKDNKSKWQKLFDLCE